MEPSFPRTAGLRFVAIPASRDEASHRGAELAAIDVRLASDSHHPCLSRIERRHESEAAILQASCKELDVNPGIIGNQDLGQIGRT
jgi:hypothetical protein